MRGDASNDGKYRVYPRVIYLVSSHKANVLGTGTPADPSAFITLKSDRTPH